MVNGTEPARLPGGTDPPAPPGTDASDPGSAAAILERLVANEATIREDFYRQPPEIVEAIARLWAAGATIAEISDETGVSKEIVRDRLRRAGLVGYPWRENHRHVREVLESRGAELAAAYEVGGSITGLAADAGISVPALRSYLASRGLAIRNPCRRTQEFLEARGEELVAAYEAGGSMYSLAADAGVSGVELRLFLIGQGVSLRPSTKGGQPKDLETSKAELIAAYEAGTTITTLAERAGVTHPTIRKLLIAEGVALRDDRGRHGKRRPKPSARSQ